ncbi:OmpW family protein [Sphingomonas sp. R-74633]|uniref:OmpW/AlkL family protein n=1 Tax=Sphingomonas sp. R-74633 TaxID=2751188 RepID=UPI0015D3C5D7|nr:OmpW family outer membrane protein [Sphingomonas sp. R-74633]NYT39745.1 OmpW family protein [Sphingomonas sp. R-74633]
MRRAIPLALALAAGIAMPAQAQEETGIGAGDVLVRLRTILVAPTEKAGPIQPGVPTGSVKVDNGYMPEVDFTYMATDHISAELIVSTTRHNIQGTGAIAGLGKVADTWALPPTLTLQYHFAPKSHVRPYVGAGVNYTIFYSSGASDSLNAALGATKVKLDDSFGYALQAGVDVDITKKVFVNLDVKFIDIDTTARLTTGGAVNKVNVSLDPFVFGAGVGFRF